MLDVRKLIPGSMAPKGADYIRLTQAGDSKFQLSTSFGGEVLLVGTYETLEDAQRAGLNRAVGHASYPLYIETTDT